MAAALLAADATAQHLPEQLFAGAHPGAVGLRVHRNTVLGAISNALRLSFVAVDRLVGEAFFDRMAVEYARAAPPSAPQLDEYGSDFPAFIADFPGTESLPFLADLARFEWQLDELGRLQAHDDFDRASLQLEGGVRLQLSDSLRLHTAHYAVDQLRTAILEENIKALSLGSLQPGEHVYALWRSPAGVKVQALSAVSALFIAAALAGAAGAQALAAAAADQSAAAVAEVLAREVLPASFIRIDKEIS